jgi:hypothetical protein
MDEDVGIRSEGVKSLVFKGSLLLIGRDLMKLGWEIVARL